MNAWYWNCLGIGFAGGMGSLARFGLNALMETWFGKAFPYGTMLVNMLGCFLFGVVWSIASRGMISVELRGILLVGFLGGFTTFSSFAFHNQQMLAHQQWGYLLTNVLMQNVVGIVAVWLGIRLMETVVPPLPVPPVL